jgi:hypothetical protein
MRIKGCFLALLNVWPRVGLGGDTENVSVNLMTPTEARKAPALSTCIRQLQDASHLRSLCRVQRAEIPPMGGKPRWMEDFQGCRHFLEGENTVNARRGTAQLSEHVQRSLALQLSRVHETIRTYLTSLPTLPTLPIRSSRVTPLQSHVQVQAICPDRSDECRVLWKSNHGSGADFPVP